jgi:membrane protein DedA with SNARE-associated domain
MMADIFTWLAGAIIKVISESGYLGIAGLMVLESACIPVPSEIIMPFSGFLAATGRFSLLWVIVFGAIGNLLGSIIAYLIGFFGGRPLIAKYGRYILLRQEEIDRAEKFFQKYGKISVFFSRLLPIIRTFISLPVGIAKMRFGKFCLYTFTGSLFWSALLAYFGIFLGENWQSIEVYFKKLDWLVGILLVLVITYFIYKKIKNKNNSL